jgi:hypothetical protein
LEDRGSAEKGTEMKTLEEALKTIAWTSDVRSGEESIKHHRDVDSRYKEIATELLRNDVVNQIIMTHIAAVALGEISVLESQLSVALNFLIVGMEMEKQDA